MTMRVIARRGRSGRVVLLPVSIDALRWWPGHIRRRGKRYEECYYSGDRVMWRDVTDEVLAAMPAPPEEAPQ